MEGMRKLFQVIIILTMTGALFIATPSARAEGTIITVDIITYASSDNHCSFQEAVAAANSNTAVDACPAGSITPGDIDVIIFNITGSGLHTITLSSELDISGPVYIDGSSQPGYSSSPLIEITTANQYLLNFESSSAASTLKALRLTNTYPGPGRAYDAVFYGNLNHIIGNYFNTDGSASGGDNVVGLGIINSSSNVIGGSTSAERNLFGGTVGVNITGDSIPNSSNNLIQGNYFGLQTDGITRLAGLPASGASIEILGSHATSNTIRGNVMAGYYNNGFGIFLHESSQTTIAGNTIGVGADGSTSSSTLGYYVGIDAYDASNNTIGGVTASDRNVISGNSYANIRLLDVSSSAHADNNIIEGNYIGTDATGSNATSVVATFGVYVDGGTGNLIGNTTAGSGNVISGNTGGISVSPNATGTLIRGNKIGLNASGAALPNSIGINLNNSTANIGDASMPGNNLISGNSYAGVWISGSSGTTIYGNRIGVNAEGLGIPNDYGVVLETGASAAISQNWIAYSLNDGVNVDTVSTVAAGSTENCFTHNTYFGVDYMNSSVSAPFDHNWWGSASGPSGFGPGTGDVVSSNVTFLPFLTTAPAACVQFYISGSTVAGATLSYIGDTSGSTEADASGDYSITVPSGWSGTVTPSFAGCTFSPTDRTYSNVTADTLGQDYNATCSLTLKSVAANDGWVLESGENTNAGGSMNSATTTINLGDDAANKQYRGILSFNTNQLPDNALIDSLKLRIKKSGVVGSDPFTSMGKIAVDIKKGSFGNNPALQKTDFQVAANQNNAALIVNTLVSGWYNRFLPSGSFGKVNLTGPTQFRLRFQTDDDNDLGVDNLQIFSGNAAANARPQLMITYHAP